MSYLLLCACGPAGDGPAAPPIRRCAVTIAHRPGGPVRDLVVAGEFNGWSRTSHRMTDPDGDGAFTVDVNVGPGEYAYRFVRDGEWILDPAVAWRKWVDGIENSSLLVEDCREPALEPISFETAFDPVSGRGTLAAVAQYVDGSQRAGIAPASISVAVNGTPTASHALDPVTNRIAIDLRDLAPGKYTVRVDAGDAAGRSARTLHLPGWVEAERFDWNDASIYSVFPDRFRNGDPSNDAPASGVEPIANYLGGDFRGIIDAIEEGYFDRLGVNALWLGPVVANPDGGFPGVDPHMYTGYHGYWPTAARETQRRFGTLDELRELTSAAHRRGIRVIVDLVMNHVHQEHPYWARHRADGWFNGDGSCVCGQGSCDWETRKLDCWFAPYLPDFDFRNHDAAVRFVEDALWWVFEADLDGFRCDAVKHMPISITMRLAGMIAERYERTGERFYLVGETFTGEDGRWEIAEFIGPFALDGQFDFPIYWAALDAIVRRGRGLDDLDAAVRVNEAFYPPGAVMSPFIGNHDVPRALSHANGDIADLWGNNSRWQAWNDPPGPATRAEPYDRLKQAFAFVLTQPGAPLIYYGDEIGMPGAGDPDNRRMMRFGASLSAFERDLLSFVQTVGQARRDLRALRRGLRVTLRARPDFYAYARHAGPGEAAIVAINRSGAEVSETLYVPSSFGLAEGATLADRIWGTEATLRGGALTVRVPPGSASIYAP